MSAVGVAVAVSDKMVATPMVMPPGEDEGGAVGTDVTGPTELDGSVGLRVVAGRRPVDPRDSEGNDPSRPPSVEEDAGGTEERGTSELDEDVGLEMVAGRIPVDATRPVSAGRGPPSVEDAADGAGGTEETASSELEEGGVGLGMVAGRIPVDPKIPPVNPGSNAVESLVDDAEGAASELTPVAGPAVSPEVVSVSIAEEKAVGVAMGTEAVSITELPAVETLSIVALAVGTAKVVAAAPVRPRLDKRPGIKLGVVVVADEASVVAAGVWDRGVSVVAAATIAAVLPDPLMAVVKNPDPTVALVIAVVEEADPTKGFRGLESKSGGELVVDSVVVDPSSPLASNRSVKLRDVMIDWVLVESVEVELENWRLTTTRGK